MADIERVSAGSNKNVVAEIQNSEKTPGVVHFEGDDAPQGTRYLHIDEATQKRVVHKLDWNIMPIVIALCMSCHFHCL